MAGSGRLTSCAMCSRRRWKAASSKAWSAQRALQSMRASSKRMRTGRTGSMAAMTTTGPAVLAVRAVQCASTSMASIEAPPPKEISLSDPASRLTAAMGRPAFFGWSANYLIDVKHAVIMDVAATPAIRTAETDATRTMVERVEEKLGLKPKRLIGDTAYGTAEMLAWMVEEKGIEPHVPLWEKGERGDGTFPRSAFAFEPATNTLTCPGGKTLQQYRRNYLTPRTGIDKDGQRRYRASQKDCQACALKEQCCPGQPMRKVSRSVHETARDAVRNLEGTPEYLQSQRDRKKVEMLFAHLKRILRLDRLRLRGPSGASDEFHLAAAVQNLRKMAKVLFSATPVPAPA
jgi:hypothetical protein